MLFFFNLVPWSNRNLQRLKVAVGSSSDLGSYQLALTTLSIFSFFFSLSLLSGEARKRSILIYWQSRFGLCTTLFWINKIAFVISFAFFSLFGSYLGEDQFLLVGMGNEDLRQKFHSGISE